MSKYRNGSRYWSVEVKAIKAAVRDRDGRCVDCGITRAIYQVAHGKDLHVHRLKPGSRYTVDGCVALCMKCHARRPEHRTYAEIRECATPKAPAMKAVSCRVPAEVYDDIIKESLRRGWDFDDEVARRIVSATGLTKNP